MCLGRRFCGMENRCAGFLKKMFGVFGNSQKCATKYDFHP